MRGLGMDLVILDFGLDVGPFRGQSEDRYQNYLGKILWAIPNMR